MNKSTNKQRVFSGMRPSGKLHIGHFEGALKMWASLQDTYECFYMVADWHALTTEYADTSRIKEDSFQMVVDWLACGLSPEKSVIFRQSDVIEHAELYLLLSMLTPVSWLERCPTYKEQISEIKDKDLSTHGFLGYPVLQTADIIIYKAQKVPVGQDQIPHLELSREICRRFNNFYGKIFPEPEPLLAEVSKLPGIDGRKMSKSYNNSIYLSDTEEGTLKKVKSMFTDPKKIKRDDIGHPDGCPVFLYQGIYNSDNTQQISLDCKSGKLGCTICKESLGKELNTVLEPIREKRTKLLQNENNIYEILENGSKKATDIAQSTLTQVRQAIGLR